MDAVFNHTGRDFFAFKDIIEKEEKSRYLDWYFIERFPLRVKKEKLLTLNVLVIMTECQS